jgi:heptosyltransferase I
VQPTIRGITVTGRFLAALHRRRFDLAVDLQGLLRSGVMAAATGAKVRVGAMEAREGAPRFYTHRVRTGLGNVHAVDRMLRIAEALGAEVSRPVFFPVMTAQDQRWAREALVGVPYPRLILNPGGRWMTKRWPPEHFAEVARRAVAEFGAGLVVVGGREDAQLAAELCERLAGLAVQNLCCTTTLPQLTAVAALAGVFLSNDTGPLHLAAATGVPVVGIYTCTSPEKTGPYGPRALAIQTGIWCAGSKLRCCERLDCMAELVPDRVWKKVERQLTLGSSNG